MKENEKNGKTGILIILTFVFAILAILSVVFTMLGLGKSNKMNQDNEDLKNEVETLKEKINNNNNNNNNTETNGNVNGIYLDYPDAGDNTKIYSVFDHFIVFSVNNELYFAKYYSALWFSSSIYLVDDLKFSGNVAHVKVVDLEADVFKLGINTDNIYKVISRHSPYYNDPTGEVYILYKDKGLTYFKEHDLNNNFVVSKSLTDYNKIINVNYSCKYGEFGCDKATYKITTSDGKTVELDKLN